GGGRIFQLELVVFGYGKDHFHLQIARIAFFSVFRKVRERQGMIVYLFGIPYLKAETLVASVYGIFTGVFGQLVGVVVERKLGIGNAVGIPAHGSSQRSDAVDVLFCRFVAQIYISQLTIFVGHQDRNYFSAIVGDLHHHALGV